MPHDIANVALPASLPNTIADDLLKGAEAIGAFIGEDRRRTFNLLAMRALPAGKLRGEWVASKTVLHAILPHAGEREPLTDEKTRRFGGAGLSSIFSRGAEQCKDLVRI
jgi:hypothetical protein